MGNMKRAPMMSAIAAALALGVWGMPAQAQTEIKIGFINSYSGFLAEPGDEMDKGVMLYKQEHDKDLPQGVTVTILKRDDTSTPEVAKRLAQELITRDHVNLLFGVVASPNAAAIAPLTAEAKIPLVITNAAGTSITRISPYVVRDSFTQWHTALPMGQWAVKQGWKTAFTAVSDFIPGHDADDAFKKGFTDAGGKVLGSIAFSPATPDFPPVVQRIRDTKPDVAFVWVPAGTQATGMMKAMQDLGIRQAGINVVSTQDLVPDEALPDMGNAAVGTITAGNYSIAGDRPANKAFLADWKKMYGDKAIPDFLSVDGWDGLAMVYAMLKETKGKFTSDEAMKFFSSYKTDASPRGPISIDPNTRDIVQNIYIRKTEMKDGKLANVEFDTIPNVKDPWKELNPPK
ncbi:MAG TPA: ABC transporter substrate-binding protein [Stellaceae bacterium]|nr:ABC transporter substrate-binding protein [Stellaceae bacterium]